MYDLYITRTHLLLTLPVSVPALQRNFYIDYIRENKVYTSQKKDEDNSIMITPYFHQNNSQIKDIIDV